MEELRAAPRTISLQQFATARAAELLSLHASVIARKRKASTLQDGAHDDGGNGYDNRPDYLIEDAALCDDEAPFPRHLRRRTSCYVRRRLPLPWLYKRKRSPFSSSSVQPRRRRRRRQKESLGGTSNQNARQDGALTCALGSDSNGTGSTPLVNLPDAKVAAIENVASANSVGPAGCVVGDENLDEVSIVSLGETIPTSILQSSKQGVLEDAATQLSQKDSGSILLLSDQNTNPLASQAAQPEIGQADRDHSSLMNVDGEAALVQGEILQDEQDIGLSSCHCFQKDSTNYISVEEAHTTMCIKSPAASNPMAAFNPQGMNNTKKNNMCRPLRRLLKFKPGSSLMALDGTRHLSTHIWHAKRFTISKLWGYRIPIGRHGRGCGSRAILRWSKSKALLHDNSFMSAIQLVGKKENIIQVLKPVLQLPEKESFVEAGEGSTGRCFTSAILHHVSQAFHGVISPVIVMWKPVLPEIGASGSTEKLLESPQDRTLWLWVHAGAFEEAYQMLKDICLLSKYQIKDDKVTCISRKGDLGRLDLLGKGSTTVLQKVLFPVCRDHEGKAVNVEQLDQMLNFEQKGKIIVYLEVVDPRLKETEHCLALKPVLTSPVVVFDDRGSKTKSFMDDKDKRAEVVVKHEQETCNTICGDECNFCHSSNKCVDALWSCSVDHSKQMVEQPVKENFLSRMRHIDRLDAFGLTQTGKSNRMSERRKTLWQRFICPVILLKHEHERASGSGWSLIVPMSWIVAFWVPLVFAGGHVIGVRERHWLCTDAGCPAFPNDFPDCKAYAEMKWDRELHCAQQCHEKLENRKISCPKQVLVGAHQDAAQDELVEKDALQELLTHALPSCAADQCQTADVSGLEYGCFVARTAQQLVSYLQTTHQTGLLLFPLHKQPTAKFQGLDNCLHKGTLAWHPKPPNLQTSTTAAARSVCLLRVCLRPFCRGVAKVGAKVYAPTLDDYMVWSCKKEKMSKGSIPEVCAGATFLGYVTSMAPRGSKERSAIAFCDAIALGLARQHQWINTTWHKNREVFLMFCNDGSTVFRPSFGSVCIEAGPDI